MEGANCVGRHLQQSSAGKVLCQTENHRGTDGFAVESKQTDKLALDILLLFYHQSLYEGPVAHRGCFL